MNLDMLTAHLRSHVLHDDQWPVDSSTVACNIDYFVVDLAGTPQLVQLSNKPSGEPSNTNGETADVNDEGGRSIDFRACGRTMAGRAVSHRAG